jgi:hypothetical protein
MTQHSEKARSSTGGLVLPFWPIPAHCFLETRHATSQSAGNLEPRHEPVLGFQVHHQYQYGDELLAGRDGEFTGTGRAPDHHGQGIDRPGAQVAREHYGAKGWVFHQNTDIWRVAAPMDGPTWGTFTVGGAWLVTHLYEHYLFTQDVDYLREVYPVIKGSVEFFMDFLVEHPNGQWLVTNPSNSPENPPEGKGYEYFYDEVTGMYYFTTIVAGATMDMQILKDLFSYYKSACKNTGLDRAFAGEVAIARERLALLR